METLSTLCGVGFLIALPFVAYVIYDAFCKSIAEKIFNKLEERKLQKEYDKIITAREERYYELKKKVDEK
jgi:hypothetical protein